MLKIGDFHLNGSFPIGMDSAFKTLKLLPFSLCWWFLKQEFKTWLKYHSEQFYWREFLNYITETVTSRLLDWVVSFRNSYVHLIFKMLPLCPLVTFTKKIYFSNFIPVYNTCNSVVNIILFFLTKRSYWIY